MGKQTIAEFVENDAILEKLKEIGVDYAQGYGIAMPQPLDEFAAQTYKAAGLKVVPKINSVDHVATSR